MRNLGIRACRVADTPITCRVRSKGFVENTSLGASQHERPTATSRRKQGVWAAEVGLTQPKTLPGSRRLLCGGGVRTGTWFTGVQAHPLHIEGCVGRERPQRDSGEPSIGATIVAGGQWSVSELCRRFRRSRPTGYKWIERIREEGLGAAAAYRDDPSRRVWMATGGLARKCLPRPFLTQRPELVGGGLVEGPGYDA